MIRLISGSSGLRRGYRRYKSSVSPHRGDFWIEIQAARPPETSEPSFRKSELERVIHSSEKLRKTDLV